MKKTLKIMLVICLIGGAYFIRTINSSGENYAPLVEMDGVKIEVGETKVKEVLDQGFTIENSEYFAPVTSVPGKKFTTPTSSFTKNGIDYGSFSVANTSSIEQDIKECTITSISYYYTNDHYYQDATVNGLVPKAMTLEQLKEKLGDPTYTYDGALVYRSKNEHYDCLYKFNKEGILESLSVEIDEHSM